jgi:hypothetical protein
MYAFILSIIGVAKDKNFGVLVGLPFTSNQLDGRVFLIQIVRFFSFKSPETAQENSCK